MLGKKADLAFTDPPYNVRIDGNATGLGVNRNREFAMASGEMTFAEFQNFLLGASDHASLRRRSIGDDDVQGQPSPRHYARAPAGTTFVIAL